MPTAKEPHRAHPTLDPQRVDPSDPIRRDVTVTRPIDPKTDPAFVPSDLQEPPRGKIQEWQKDEFKAKVLAAGFPTGNAITDDAFLQAAYKISGGTIAQEEEPVPAETEHKAPVTHGQQKKE
jgi:hypothetical protein